MPIIKSAKKRVKQAEKRRKRNYPLRSKMKTFFRRTLAAIKEGKKDEANKLIPQAYKVIDTAAKKNIIHKNNAARKKSRLAKALANIDNPKPKATKKKKKKITKKKTAAKKEKTTKEKED